MDANVAAVIAANIVWFIITMGPIMAYSLTDALAISKQQRLLLDVLRAIKTEYPGVGYFDTWYYAVRYVKRSRLADLIRICEGNPAECKNHQDSYAVGQIAALFKKRADIDHGIDKAAVALSAFLTSEAECKEMNRVLRDETDVNYNARAVLIHSIQRKISQFLGPAPSPHQLKCGFGPGSNIGCSENTNAANKLTANATTTVDALYLLRDVLRTADVAWRGLKALVIVGAARFATVSKNWKTDRGILIEPLVNTFLQKGIGAAIRARLRLFGCDLTNQSLNQSRALIGSRTGKYATVDLKSASDCIASLLVLDLLPYEWFELLYACRSHRACLPCGRVVTLEKFSSMGNGYTFELESLIFFALAKVICGEDVSVYGDDIIVPTEHYDSMIAALRLLGFTPNDTKSFGSGPFRESCGGDFFDGVNVRPIFFDDSISYMDVMRLYNWSLSTGRLRSLRESLKRLVPKRIRSWGPAGYGDTYFHCEYTRVPLINDKRGFGAFRRFRMWLPKQRTTRDDSYTDFLGFLYWRTYRNLGELTYDDVGRNVRSRHVVYKLRTVTAYCQ